MSSPTKPPGRVVGTRRLLGEALALARGEVLEDEPYADWAEELRRTYGARVLHARLDAAEAALADQDPTAALTHAEAAVARDRFAERGYRLAMLAQHALGRRHEALQTFDRLQGILHEIDLEPTAETAELRSAILRGEEHETLLPSRTTAPSFPSDLHKVLVLDPPGDRIVDANRPACEMLSYERDELLATPISAIHPAEMPAFLRFMEQAKAAGVAWTMQLTCRTKTGHFLPTESWAHPLTLGGELYMLILLRETSEHRERPPARPA